ncbi:phage regulatory CII family protein [Pseudomonadota bacterium]
MSERGVEFAQLMSGLITVQKRYTVEELMPVLGLSKDQVYARIRQDNPTAFSVDEIQKLLAYTKDIEIASEVFMKTPFMAAFQPNHSSSTEGDAELVKDAAVSADIEMGHIVEAVIGGLQDGRICIHDKKRIEAEIADSEHSIATLKAHVEKTG